MSIVRMTSETCYHDGKYGYDEKGNLKVPMCDMLYSAEEKTLTCPTCGKVERNVVKVSNYDGHEEGLIRHSEKCVHRGQWKDLSGKHSPECITYDMAKAAGHYDYCHGPFRALYMQESHVGLVLEDRERNGYDDSDFYAVVWNWEKGCTEHVEYATTRAWTYPNRCKVDATPEVIAAWRAWSEVKRKEYAALQAEKEAKRVARGKTLVVSRGRKVPKGTIGECFWYGSGMYGDRVGIKDAKGEVYWTAAKNCDVVQVAEEKKTG